MAKAARDAHRGRKKRLKSDRKWRFHEQGKGAPRPREESSFKPLPVVKPVVCAVIPDVITGVTSPAHEYFDLI